MPDSDEELRKLAEICLDEMLEAERTRDFGAWSRRWQERDLKGLDERAFLDDLDRMEKVLGAYRSRDYLGVIHVGESAMDDDGSSRKLRFIFKAAFEKTEAMFAVGLRKLGGNWYVYANTCSV